MQSVTGPGKPDVDALALLLVSHDMAKFHLFSLEQMSFDAYIHASTPSERKTRMRKEWESPKPVPCYTVKHEKQCFTSEFINFDGVPDKGVLTLEVLSINCQISRGRRTDFR